MPDVRVEERKRLVTNATKPNSQSRDYSGRSWGYIFYVNELVELMLVAKLDCDSSVIMASTPPF